jgi:hypothetical protein
MKKVIQNTNFKRVLITAFIMALFCVSFLYNQNSLVKAELTTSSEYGLADLDALGITYTSSPNTGIVLDGSDYLNRSSFLPLDGEDAFSVSIWVKFDIVSSTQTILSQYHSPNNEISLKMEEENLGEPYVFYLNHFTNNTDLVLTGVSDSAPSGTERKFTRTSGTIGYIRKTQSFDIPVNSWMEINVTDFYDEGSQDLNGDIQLLIGSWQYNFFDIRSTGTYRYNMSSYAGSTCTNLIQNHYDQSDADYITYDSLRFYQNNTYLMQDASFRARVSNGVTTEEFYHSEIVETNTLYHLVFQWESGDGITLYVNDTMEHDTDNLSGTSSCAGGLYVGDDDTLSNGMDGEIYSLSFYDEVISNVSVNTIFNNTDLDYVLENVVYVYTFDDYQNRYPDMTSTYVVCENSSEYMPFNPINWNDGWNYRQYRTTIEQGVPTADNQFSYLSIDYTDEIYHAWYYYLENLTYFATVWDTTEPIISGQGQFFKLRFYAVWDDGSVYEAYTLHIKKGLSNTEIRTDSFTSGDYWQIEIQPEQEISVEFRRNYDNQYILDVGYGDIGNTNFTSLCHAESEFGVAIARNITGWMVVNQAYINPVSSGVIWSKLMQWKAQSNIIIESASMVDALNIPDVVVYYNPFVGNLLLDILTFIGLIWNGFVTIIFSAGAWLLVGFPLFITSALAVAIDLLMTAMFYAIQSFISLFDTLMVLIGLNITWSQVWELLLYIPQFLANGLTLLALGLSYVVDLFSWVFLVIDWFNLYILPWIPSIQFYVYRYGGYALVCVSMLVIYMCLVTESFEPIMSFANGIKFVGMVIVNIFLGLGKLLAFLLNGLLIIVRG